MLPPLLLLLLGPRAQGQLQGSGDKGLEDIKARNQGLEDIKARDHGLELPCDQGQEDGPIACLGTGACYQVRCYGSFMKTFSDQLQASLEHPQHEVSPLINQ